MNKSAHSTFKIIPIPAFEDNYIWLLHNDTQAIVVDPGDAEPTIATLKARNLDLLAILITHHHHDHIGGVSALMAEYPDATVYAPKNESYAFTHVPVSEPETIMFDGFNPNHPLTFSVIDLPGHTLGHVAYYAADILFCGDTLFGAGCGRLFEGSPTQMYSSLQKLAVLPPTTKVYCTHEYTLHNLGFAMQYEPNNPALIARLANTRALRALAKPSLPSDIALERATNPYLRCNSTEIKHNIQLDNANSLEVFTALRLARNQY